MNATHNIDDDKPRNERGIIKAEYYIDDEAFDAPTTELPGIGQKTAETLAEEHDVETIADVIIAQLDDDKDGILDEIAEYEGLRETLRGYEDYSRYEAYPVTADTYDGPHEIDEFQFFDGNAPVYATEGDRVCIRINDRDEMCGELEIVELSSSNTVWLHIRADDDNIYQIVYERGEWVWATTVSDSEADEIEVEFLGDGKSVADDDGDESASTTAEATTDGLTEAATDFDAAGEVGGHLLDGHELTERARDYAHHVLHGDAYPMGPTDVDLSKVEWKTSARMQRKHGHAGYGTRAEEKEYYIHLSEKSYEEAGWDFIAETVRHELIHIWQYQNEGKLAVVGGDGVEDATYPEVETTDEDWNRLGERYESGEDGVVRADGGHGDDFRAWCDVMDVSGRTSTYDADLWEHYRYTLYCRECGKACGGRHRICPAVESQTRVCAECGDTLVLARRHDGHVEWLDGILYHPDELRTFADGETDESWSEFVVRQE